jgi:hypothetical protein
VCGVVGGIPCQTGRWIGTGVEGTGQYTKSAPLWTCESPTAGTLERRRIGGGTSSKVAAQEVSRKPADAQ